MAKFDKNLKNEFFNEEELYDEDYGFDAEDDGYADDNQEFDAPDDEGEVYEFSDDGTELTEEAPEEESEEESGEQAEENETPEESSSKARWYVVHTYSGYENKVKLSIEKMVENRGMQDLIRKIEIPTEDVIEETRSGERKVRKSKLFPGYVIVNMVLTSDSWYLIRNTQGVTGFVGPGSKPIPLKDEEVVAMGVERIPIVLDIEVGENVRIINGPLENFIGRVDNIDVERQKVKLSVSMFGRETPVELDFVQVQKL
jgi:transcriptional antiterminator NusG